MKVKHLIEELQKYDEDEILLINWWDKPWFVDWVGMNITDEQWEQIVHAGDDILDTNQLGQKLIDMAVEQINKNYDNRDNA
jgi:hypothetical protein